MTIPSMYIPISRSVAANSLGLLVLVVAIFGLELLNLGHVLRLRLFGGEAILGESLPGVVLCLALCSCCKKEYRLAL